MYRISDKKLLQFCKQIFTSLGMGTEHAKQCSGILVEADLRGISSHGCNALKRYIASIEEGTVIPHANPIVLSDAPCVSVINACASMGMVSSLFALESVIKKAKKQGIAIVTVKNANHFCFGGYYAQRIAKQNMLGLALSNTAAIAVPPFGTKARLGSNSISFAAPSKLHPHFVLDMSTTVVPRGLIKKYADENRSIPEGWAVDDKGNYIKDSKKVIENLNNNIGGLVTLGSFDTLLGGHKGYGLSLMVDMLTGILSGFDASYQIKDSEKAAAKSAHTFIAINIEHFRSINDFTNDMDNLLNALIHSPAIEGKSITFHGQKAAEHVKEQKQKGILLSKTCYQSLAQLAKKYNRELLALLQ